MSKKTADYSMLRSTFQIQPFTMHPTQQFTDHILQLIAKDQMPEAISAIQQLLKGSPLFNEAILHSARYNDIMKSIRMGVVDAQQANTEKNKIRYALMDMLRELEESMEQNQALKTEVENYLQKPGAVNNTATISGDGNIVIQGSSGNQINIKKA